MNKKYMFGFLGLFMFALVSAGVVNYLSETQEVSMDVESPMVITEITGVSELDSFHGGETASISFDVENLADVEIDAKMEIVISNTEGISVNDFESISVEISEGSWGAAIGNALIADGAFIESVEKSGGNLVITTTSQPWQAGKAPWHVAGDITFATNSVGHYNIAVTMIPVIE